MQRYKGQLHTVVGWPLELRQEKRWFSRGRGGAPPPLKVWEEYWARCGLQTSNPNDSPNAACTRIKYRNVTLPPAAAALHNLVFFTTHELLHCAPTWV